MEDPSTTRRFEGRAPGTGARLRDDHKKHRLVVRSKKLRRNPSPGLEGLNDFAAVLPVKSLESPTGIGHTRADVATTWTQQLLDDDEALHAGVVDDDDGLDGNTDAGVGTD